MANITSFTWDNSSGESHNGRHLFIGQHLPKAEDGYNENCLVVYGIGMYIADTKKDMQLHSFSCHNKNLENPEDIESVSKETARELLIAEIDKALDILFAPENIKDVNDLLNVSSNEDERDEDED